MFRTALAGAIAGLLLLTGIGLASAQGYPRDYAPGYGPGYGPGWGAGPPSGKWRRPPPAQDRGNQLLPPKLIVASLLRRGYSDVQIKRVRGDSYIAEASGPNGGRVLIVVDGHTTEITGLRQIGWDRPPRQWDNDGWPPPRPWSGPRW